MRFKSAATALLLAVFASTIAAVPPSAVQAAAANSSASTTAALDAELARLGAAGNPAAALVLRSREAFPSNRHPKHGPLTSQERSATIAEISKKRAGGGFQALALDCNAPWHYMLHGETGRNVKIQSDLKAYAIGQPSFEPWYQWVLPCYESAFDAHLFYSNRGGFLTAPAFQQMFISSALLDGQIFLWGSFDGNWDTLYSTHGGGWYVSGHTSDRNHPVVADTWPLNGSALWKIRPI